MDHNHPDERSIARAARVIREGGLVAYPTETYYALGADALNPRAVEKVYRAKGRGFSKALSVIIDRTESLAPLVAEVPSAAGKLMEQFWPGPLTIIFTASGKVPASLTAGTGKIAVRVPSSAAARALASEASRPLTATSANRSGRPALTSAQQVSAHLGRVVDMTLEGGETPGGPASTVIDVTASPPVLIREGRVTAGMIEGCLHQKVSGLH